MGSSTFRFDRTFQLGGQHCQVLGDAPKQLFLLRICCTLADQPTIDRILLQLFESRLHVQHYSLLSCLYHANSSAPCRRELHIGAAFVFPQPAPLDRARKGGAVLRRQAALGQKGRIDLLDMDAAVLDGLDRVGGLDQPACGGFRIGEGRGAINFVIRSSCERSGYARRNWRL
jgi:hypothetical protein